MAASTTKEREPDYVRNYSEHGITIEFFDGKGSARRYLVTCEEQGIVRERFTSVTTITGAYEAAGLKYAAHKLGIAGAVELANQGVLPLDVDAALKMMKERKLAFWSIWSAKAALGTAAHKDLVTLAEGLVKDLETYAPGVQGFVRGISAWMADFQPKILEAEVPVASVEHRYAGRFDWLVELELPLWGHRGIVDLKTTEKLPRTDKGLIKPPYEEHALQVRLYDIAARENGYEPTGWQGILRVDQEGDYDFTLSWVDDELALGCLTGYRAFNGVTRGAPAPKPLLIEQAWLR